MSTNNPICTNIGKPSSDAAIRLKLLRELAGLSQRELAKRAGMTNSTISTIEQGQVSPSLQSLERILSAIPISLSDFFVFNLEPNLAESASISPRQLNSQVVILPAQYAGTFSTACADLTGVVLDGALTLVQPQGVQILGPGDSFYLPGGQLFRFSNLTADDLHFFWACCVTIPPERSLFTHFV